MQDHMSDQVQEHERETAGGPVRSPAAEQVGWRVELFGPTRVTTPQGVVTSGDLGGVKPRQILEILAASAGSPVPKEQLAELLWEGHPPTRWLGTLESYVCVLRRSLGLAGGRRSGILTVRHGYLLDPEVVAVDLASFRTLVREARACGEPATSLARLELALDLTDGQLLATEAYTGWAIREREHFQTELVSAAGLAASQAMALGRPEVASRMARLALARDHLAEQAWRVLMQALCAQGRRSEAIRAYFELRDLLGDELGTDPSQETTDLYLLVLRGGPTPATGQVSARDEVTMLMQLLRQALSAVPGVELCGADRALVRAAELAMVS